MYIMCFCLRVIQDLKIFKKNQRAFERNGRETFLGFSTAFCGSILGFSSIFGDTLIPLTSFSQKGQIGLWFCFWFAVLLWFAVVR